MATSNSVPNDQTCPGELRGFLEIEDEELKFFTRRFFELSKERDVLEYYKQDPRVSRKFLFSFFFLIYVFNMQIGKFFSFLFSD